MTIITKSTIADFKKTIREAKAKDRRVVEKNQMHYYVFDYMDDGEMVCVEEDLHLYKDDGRYSITPFTKKHNDKMIEDIKDKWGLV